MNDPTEPVAFSVPNWNPPSVNSFTGRHWAKIHKAKKDAAALLSVYALRCGVKRVTYQYRPVRRITVEVRYKGTEPDHDNYYKVLNDALKRALLIVDDSAKWLMPYLPTFTHTDGDPELCMTIADVRLGPELKPEDDPELKKLLTKMAKRLKRMS